MKIDIDKSSLEMTEWTCCACGCVQWMPTDHNDSLRRSHKTFYCVNGHSQHYPKKTPIEEVEEKLMNEYSKNAQLESRIKKLEKERTQIVDLTTVLKDIKESQNAIRSFHANQPQKSKSKSFLKRIFSNHS